MWTVKIDRGQIEQVLLNLFVNAWQAMPGGGHLYIKTENKAVNGKFSTISQPGKKKYVKVSVTDTGIGMDKETMKKIFNPFFTTKGTGHGTGLGLASAYGIIQNHDGFFNVKSTVGKGSTFSFYLPAVDEVAEEREESDDTELMHGTGTILLVDDEAMVLDVASGMLEKLGYKVIRAINGKEAIKIYEKEKDNIDLVILDVIMPGMSGSDTFKAIKRINPDAKILLSSGYSLSGEVRKIMEQGCNAFVQKPYNAQALSQKVFEALGKIEVCAHYSGSESDTRGATGPYDIKKIH